MKHSKKLQLIVAMTAIAYGAPSAFADDAINPLVVTASRFKENLNQVPANVKIISREEIEGSSSNNIPQILSQIGGVLISGQGLGGPLNLDATVDMGGFGSTATSTTIILVDGQRLNPTDSSTVNWESIPIDSIERIEILQGGASVQYGNGAVGGVINIITNGGVKNLNQASATYGSFNTLINNAIFRNKVDNTTLQLSANTSNTNGWRQNSAASAYSVDGKITHQFGGIDSVYIDVFANRTNAQMAGPVVGEVGTGSPQLAYFKNMGSAIVTNNSGVRAGLTKGITDSVTFEGDVFFNNKDSGFNLPYNLTPESMSIYGPNGPSNSSLNGWSLAISPRVKINLGQLGTTIVGYDYSKANANSADNYGPLAQQFFVNSGYSLLGNKQSVNLVNNSIYIISRLPVPLVNGLEAVGGYRYQSQNASTADSNVWAANGAVNANQTYSANAADLALNYTYDKGQKLFVKWDQSFRFANTDEFWGFDPITGNRVFTGILQPQLTQTYSAGGDWTMGGGHLSASVFQSVSKNEIRYDPSTGFNINTVGNVNRGGLVFDSSMVVGKGLTIAGGGKLQKSIYTDGPVSGVPVGVSPNVILNARANYLITPNWSIGGVINYVGTQTYDTDPLISGSLPKVPAYTVADLYSSYTLGPWDFKFSIKNIGNSSYATYAGNTSSGGQYPTVGKYFYYPSIPTSYFVTVKYTF